MRGAKKALSQAQSKYGVKGRPPFRDLPYFDPLHLLEDGHPPDGFHIQYNTISSGILRWINGNRAYTDPLHLARCLDDDDLSQIGALARLVTFSSNSSRVAPCLIRKIKLNSKTKRKTQGALAATSSDYIEASRCHAPPPPAPHASSTPRCAPCLRRGRTLPPSAATPANAVCAYSAATIASVAPRSISGAASR